MLLKIFGLLDLLGGIFLILSYFDIGKPFVSLLAFFLLIKGIIYLWDFNSILDVFSSVIMFFSILGHTSFLIWLVALWLLQKGFFSLLSEE